VSLGSFGSTTESKAEPGENQGGQEDDEGFEHELTQQLVVRATQRRPGKSVSLVGERREELDPQRVLRKRIQAGMGECRDKERKRDQTSCARLGLGKKHQRGHSGGEDGKDDGMRNAAVRGEPDYVDVGQRGARRCDQAHSLREGRRVMRGPGPDGVADRCMGDRSRQRLSRDRG